MTATADFIANLLQNKFSPLAEPIVGKVDLFVLCLQELAAALPNVQTYTPTLTNVANLDASMAFVTQFYQLGNCVIVWGEIDIDPTTNGVQLELGVSLPVASVLSVEAQLAGVGSTPAAIDRSTAFSADTVNNRARMRYIPANNTNHQYFFIFVYVVN